MRWTILTAVLTCGALLVSSYAYPAAGGWKRSIQERAYDTETVATVSGTVKEVEETTRTGGRSGGIHVVMKTEDGVVQAYLGPKWYIDNLDLDLKKGDSVEVTGSRLYIDETEVIIVRSIKRGSETVVLRDEDGVPNWSGWRRGGRR